MKKTFRRIWASPSGRVGLILTCLLIVIAILAPLLAPHSPTDMFMNKVLQRPGHGFPFGTDQFGRDLLSRMLYGLRTSLWVAFTSIVSAAILGTLFGAIAGYAGGWLDRVIMGVMEIFMAFPALLLAIGIMTMLGTSLINVIVAITLVYLPVFARVIRGPVLAMRQGDMAKAIYALGASDYRILVKHIIPNCLSPVIVQASMAISDAILVEAALSYLGLGVKPPFASLGSLIQDGQAMMLFAPHLTVFPGILIAMTVLAFNLLGDAVRDVLDPRLRNLAGFRRRSRKARTAPKTQEA